MGDLSDSYKTGGLCLSIALEILLYGKLELVDKDSFESINIVLFAGVSHNLTYLEFIIQRMVIGAGDVDSTVA